MYEDRGTGGTPILFIHGLASSHRAFEQFFQQYFLREGRLIIIDLPGFGRTPELSVTHTIDLYTDIVKDLLDELGVKKARIMGSSMGATVTLAFGIKYPEYAEALVAH